LYGAGPVGENRYSPAGCIGIKKSIICGRPDDEHISNSYGERQNVTMKMSMRRFKLMATTETIKDNKREIR
jgi:hypothetical protein